MSRILYRYHPWQACLRLWPALVLLWPARVRAQGEDPPPSAEEALREAIENPRAVFDQVWRFELFRSGDTAVQLNQVVVALLLILVGMVLSRWFSKLLRRRLDRFSRVNPSVAAIVQSLFFYTTAGVITLVALPMVGIPITIFTVLGGALAIGIGFGAQNIINNFISSLIIMAERPIRIGDMVQVGEHLGRVESIGGRSTRINSFDGIDVLVPNSYFLENPVVNWTLSNSLVRTRLRVGVAYGSPTRRCAQLISQATREHPKVLKTPEPTVIFDDFGDSSLVFEVLFWTDVMRPLDLRIVASDLRYRIDELFHENGIVIAFPQRDVHLDTLGPLQVQMVDGRPTGGGA